MAYDTKHPALAYHEDHRYGKIEVLPVKKCETQMQLALAYSPGVAECCRAIVDDEANAVRYTGRNNLVGVITNGTAVLGLGNIGPLPGKPVMEGKAVLFKAFADVDAFDIELDCLDPDKFIEVVKTMEPTFGGINLEDIRGPECFYIEEQLKKSMNIPVFHDDQHGTAVITGAALMNAAKIVHRNVSDMKIVVMGAGAAGMACARFYNTLGVRAENITMFDIKGLVHKGRTDLSEVQMTFAQPEPVVPASYAEALTEALRGANLLLGLSGPGTLKAEMLKGMAPSPVIFACANPTPEISYEEAKAVRPDAIMGTGRSDRPNQVNNVSCFPFLFRGALDAGATDINEPMKIAASKAISELAHEEVPEEVSKAYQGRHFEFGPDYIIPTPFDPRLIEWIAPAVAQAAMDTGVSRTPIRNMEAYRKSLRRRMDAARGRIRALVGSYE